MSSSIFWVGLVIVAAWATHRFRQAKLFVELPKVNHEDFDGTLYQVDRCLVAYRPARNGCQQTILGMHGWVEDHRYFTELYVHTDAELILINSCDYHGPNLTQPRVKPDWAQIPNQSLGSIEYDAAVVIQSIKKLATGSQLRLHGHSRGGAVVLESLKQAPELLKNAEIILEAAILPEAPLLLDNPVIAPIMFAIVAYILPLVGLFMSRVKLPKAIMSRFGPVTPRKTLLIQGLFNNPKYPQILEANIKNMQSWPLENSVALYDLASHGTILIAEKDTVLSVKKMLASALRTKGNFKVVETKGTSHFISLDAPHYVPSLLDQAA
jgi:pimeloyl-ACP methyl ester carboxylesterase